MKNSQVYKKDKPFLFWVSKLICFINFGIYVKKKKREEMKTIFFV